MQSQACCAMWSNLRGKAEWSFSLEPVPVPEGADVCRAICAVLAESEGILKTRTWQGPTEGLTILWLLAGSEPRYAAFQPASVARKLVFSQVNKHPNYFINFDILFDLICLLARSFLLPSKHKYDTINQQLHHKMLPYVIDSQSRL